MATLLRPFAGNRSHRIAANLLDHFGSLDRAISTADEVILRVCKADEDVAQLIIAARRLILAASRENVTRSKVEASDPALREYLQFKLRSRSNEELHAVYFDVGGGFLSEECVGVGGVSHIQVRIRQIVERALQLGAAGFILAHNHPSGEPHPSEADVTATLTIARVARAMELDFADHLIVTRRTVVGMKELGLL